jgi:predicted secreted protein
MAAQKGKDMLLKVRTAVGVFTTVAGLRARKMAFNAETVDVTDADSAGRWRELIGGAICFSIPPWKIGKLLCLILARLQASSKLRRLNIPAIMTAN